ncbi:hypothetical protein V500_06552 [Pseudogymnoascus sp. VKM F-4518 (FW-2643)]|nr:hypothetical protein V500_06552 [Pseudogymnoascus sp. VKM F-4518 (FW-2643)]
MPSASKLWRRSSSSSFFHENPLRILKRRAQAAHRRRCTMDEPPTRAQHSTLPSTSPSNPPASHCEPPEPAPAPAVAPAPTTQRATADSSSQTDLSIPPSADDPDPFSEELEPAIEVDNCDIIPPPAPPPRPTSAPISKSPPISKPPRKPKRKPTSTPLSRGPSAQSATSPPASRAPMSVPKPAKSSRWPCCPAATCSATPACCSG